MALSKEEIFQEVVNIIAKNLNNGSAEDIRMGSTFKELGADSLDIIEMKLEFEDIDGGIFIHEADAEKIETVADAVAIIYRSQKWTKVNSK
jgi:acyl carrier protein